MIVSNRINLFRKAIMRKITKDIGKKSLRLKNEKDLKIKRILVTRPNHRLGNLLLLTPLIQEITNTFPECEIDLFVRGHVAPIVFKNYENVKIIIQLPKKPFSNIIKYILVWTLIKRKKYDLVINAIQNSSSGKLSTLYANATYKFFGEFHEELQEKFIDYHHNAKYPIYNFRHYLMQLGFQKNENQLPFLNIFLNNQELENGSKIVREIVKNDKKTICLFTNATGGKCYSEDWWHEFYEKIEIEFPDYNFIEMLPVEKISKLCFKVPTFYSTDIREMAAVIANTVIFIGADSGVMHLASASGTPTIGLFSVTEERVYGPYNNRSLAINTNKVNNAEMFALIRDSLKT